MNHVIMQSTINESLDNAIFNGYEIDEWDAIDIATDLHEYDSQFEGIEPTILLPFVQAWKSQRQAN